MSCCCCDNIYKLPPVNACNIVTVSLPSTAPASGVYTLKLDFLNSIIQQSKTIAQGDPFVFEFAGLNENYTFRGRYEDAAGARVIILVDDIQYDCIEFKTTQIVTVT